MIDMPITEQLYSNKKFLDKISDEEALKLMISEHQKSADSVMDNLQNIKTIIEIITVKLKKSNSSRLVYVGAGTSGRLGLQDGIELHPTFGWPLERLEFLLAGGYDSLIKPVEKAEDNIKDAIKIFRQKKINSKDVVIGLAASGNTPFTCEILRLSQQKKATTIAISNNPKGKILSLGEYSIILNTKKEVLAGSTRLKAGTAQKICLNVISTLVMTKLGYVKNGMMSNLVATNEKLLKRQKFIKNKIAIK